MEKLTTLLINIALTLQCISGNLIRYDKGHLPYISASAFQYP